MAKASNSRFNRKMNQNRDDGYAALRVYDRAAGKRKMGLVKCGDCDESVEIYYDEDSIEINGVNGSIQNWREVLLPLLGMQ